MNSCKQRVNFSFLFLKASAFDFSSIRTYLSLFFFVTFVNASNRNFSVLKFLMIFVFTISAYYESFSQFFQSFFQFVLMSFRFEFSFEIKIFVVTSTFFNANEINEFSIIEDTAENALIILDNLFIITRFFSETCTIFR